MKSLAQPNLSKVRLWADYQAEPRDSDALVMYTEAKDYLEFYDWCAQILDSYVGILHPGVVAVFLFEIRPSRKDVDDWVWVIVGDLPPAYVTTDQCPNPAAALEGYIGAMREWVEAASTAKSVASLIPVNVPATPEYAEKLRFRLDFLDERILIDYGDDLGE